MRFIKSDFDINGTFTILWQRDHYHYEVESLTKTWTPSLELVNTNFEKAVEIFDNIVSGRSKM